MKVLHIAYQYGLNNTGGAAIASTRLHNALLNAGIESHYVCLRQCEDGENVHVMPSDGSLLDRLFKIPKIRGVWNRFHLPIWGFEKIVNEINPDVIHVQWLNMGGPTFKQIVQLKRKTIVNLHDLWPISAVLPFPPPEDVRWINGYRRENSTRKELKEFARKLCFIKQLNPVFIGPSRWACLCAQQSIIGKGYETYAIPNLIDERYSFDPLQYKKGDKFIVLFGCNGGRLNRQKGYEDLQKALQCLPYEIRTNIEVRIFGEDKVGAETDGAVCIRSLGRVNSAAELKIIYNQADVFAFPSRSETQGMTKIEALLCGLPVIAFDRAACAEGVVHKTSGWVSTDGDIEDFAAGIKYYFELWRSGALLRMRGSIAAQHAKDNEKILVKIMDVYKGNKIG